MSYSRKEVLDCVTKLIFVVHGGIGRNIEATAVVRALKKAYPQKDIVVVAGCPEVFLKNPNVSRVHNLGTPNHIYEDYFKKQKALLLQVEPYQHFDYISRQKHFIECWCDMLDIPCDGLEPELFYNINEMEIAKDYLAKFDRRMVLFQHQGGKVPESSSKKDKILAKTGMYRRSLPEDVAQKVTDKLIEMGYMVGSVGHPNQFLPRGAEAIKFPIRAILALVPLVEAVISVDSFLLHGSACFKAKTPTISIWGGTDPKVLGYPWHTNLVREVCDNPMCHRPNSYLWDFEGNGFLWDCPHNDICMSHDADDIIQNFKTIVKESDDGEPKRNPDFKAECPAEEGHSCKKEGVPCDCERDSHKEISADVGAN